MAERVVMDASAAIAILRDEKASSDVRDVILERAQAERWVSSFFWLEVANSLARRHGFSPAQVAGAIATLDDLDLHTAEGDRTAMLASVALASEHGLTVYDASYLALAEHLDARLLTLDGQLAAAAGERALDVGGPRRRRVREPRPAYELRPWVRWRDLDRYVEAVREVTIASVR